MCILAAVVAESRFVWRSLHDRDLAASEQGLLLGEKSALQGHKIYGKDWTEAEEFVARHLIGADLERAADATAFVESSQAGDYFLTRSTLQRPDLREVARNARFALYRREF